MVAAASNTKIAHWGTSAIRHPPTNSHRHCAPCESASRLTAPTRSAKTKVELGWGLWRGWKYVLLNLANSRLHRRVHTCISLSFGKNSTACCRRRHNKQPGRERASRVVAMGIKNLWQLLSPVGRSVSIETLAGKVRHATNQLQFSVEVPTLVQPQQTSSCIDPSRPSSS